MADSNDNERPTKPRMALDFIHEAPTEPSRVCPKGDAVMIRKGVGTYVCPACGETAP
jgi:hypothetical protein